MIQRLIKSLVTRLHKKIWGQTKNCKCTKLNSRISKALNQKVKFNKPKIVITPQLWNQYLRQLVLHWRTIIRVREKFISKWKVRIPFKLNKRRAIPLKKTNFKHFKTKVFNSNLVQMQSKKLIKIMKTLLMKYLKDRRIYAV